MITANIYDINGKHTLSNLENKPLRFDSIEQAKDFLKTIALMEDDEIENISFESMSDEEWEKF